jgi:hypothetical protein
VKWVILNNKLIINFLQLNYFRQALTSSLMTEEINGLASMQSGGFGKQVFTLLSHSVLQAFYSIFNFCTFIYSYCQFLGGGYCTFMVLEITNKKKMIGRHA